ncbi:MAG: hypothetical protein FWF41_05500 [Betaproteobacteria bacterium]|nr:hypothetical protein [Betaproteobacteria bacterium]
MTEKRATYPDWSAIEQDYVSGWLSVRELAAKHDVMYETARARCKRGEWNKKRRALREKTERAALESQTEKRARDLVDFNNADIEAAKELRLLTRISMREARERGNMTGAELRAHAAAIETAQRIGRIALGLPTENRELSGALAQQVSGKMTVEIVREPVDGIR